MEHAQFLKQLRVRDRRQKTCGLKHREFMVIYQTTAEPKPYKTHEDAVRWPL